MRQRLGFLRDEQEDMGLSALLGTNGSRGGTPRPTSRGTSYFSPGPDLTALPWYGFPGGQEAWTSFKATGQMPTNPATGQPHVLSPGQQDWYYKNPIVSTPTLPEGVKTTGTALPSQPPHMGGTLNTGASQPSSVAPTPYTPGSIVDYIPTQPTPTQTAPQLQSAPPPPPTYNTYSAGLSPLIQPR